ncbi:ectoine utilization protein EutA [Boseongicola aestuarii]|uniref:Maleate isomerase n=1 Tax=Boseongicola aestuarii TaxID=1470561 RepID=A0A238J5W7_9RHOB|nr:ectoine utilization protein EutA [Boseongicola aestuarii]SMX25274.1 Maleate isomerase [Boseongicola aestuarii]
MSGSCGVTMTAAQEVHCNISPVAAQLDARPVEKRIGLVALATDHTTETDFARMMHGHDIGFYVNRIEFENPTTHESLLRTGPRLTDAAKEILPDEPLDVLVYGCTAASVVLGNDKVAEHMSNAKPGTACVTPSSAAFDAFDALGVNKISVLTPYTQDITDSLVRYFLQHGRQVVNAACFGLADDRDMARVSKQSIIEGGVAACDPDADALFISCTAVRAASCVAQLEDRLGKPVVTSNQAMVWRCLRHLGITSDYPAGGMLFKKNVAMTGHHDAL